MKRAPAAEWVPSATTTLWGPLGNDGMVKVNVVPPLGPVVPPDTMVAGVRPTSTVRAFEGAKPSTEIWAVEPTMPLEGLRPVAVDMNAGLLSALGGPSQVVPKVGVSVYDQEPGPGESAQVTVAPRTEQEPLIDPASVLVEAS